MGDQDEIVEDIMAEPELDSPGFLPTLFFSVHSFIASNGWYILAAGLGIYFLWKNKIAPVVNSAENKSPEDIQAWQSKEEQRLKAIEKLQEKYKIDADVRAEKQKLMEEQKKKARMAELEELTKGSQKLGEGSSKSKASFKPEYNPLMGDASSSGRVCFRRPGGGSGG